MTPVRIEPARVEDLEAIQTLLRAAGLPWEDIDSFLDDFFVLRSEEGITGAVGLEVRGQGALVRSLVVKEGLRGNGLGRELYNGILDHARRRGIRQLGLLTETAEGFFARAGFHVVSRDEAPAFIRESREFRELCASSAVLMTLELR